MLERNNAVKRLFKDYNQQDQYDDQDQDASQLLIVLGLPRKCPQAFSCSIKPLLMPLDMDVHII